MVRTERKTGACGGCQWRRKYRLYRRKYRELKLLWDLGISNERPMTGVADIRRQKDGGRHDQAD